MTQHRLYLDSPLAAGGEIEIAGDKARYLGRVLRLRVRDEISVFNGRDGEFSAAIVAMAKDQLSLVVRKRNETATESTLRVHLVQGVSRGERMDFVVQKATELGVKRITPVLTEYGVVKLSPERAAKRQAHWQKVAISACEQSGRIRPPLVEAPLALKSWLGQRTAKLDTDLILVPGASTSLASLAAPQTKLCLLTGPEGGFSETELEDAAVSGFRAVSLGPRVLRTETAAVAAISVSQSLWGDLQ